MKRLIRLLIGVMVPAFMVAGLAVQPAAAQDKAKETKKEVKKDAKAAKGKAAIKELFQNDKVRVVEATFKPGDEAPNAARPFRVIRPLKGGTLTRIFADGKTEKVVFKTGEVKVLEADKVPYIPKNEGKSDIVLYLVFLKEPKK
ncbi:MAG: hypothetical protein HY322_12870 [Betaproteobacteria bacterium]|nr:hypothetical protein [Betaproteobacteria bacterium]